MTNQADLDSLLLQYAGNDARINEGWPAYEAALRANHVDYNAYVYEGKNHGFHNDTTPRYDEEAATLSWERTITFFKDKLGSSVEEREFDRSQAGHPRPRDGRSA